MKLSRIRKLWPIVLSFLLSLGSTAASIPAQEAKASSAQVNSIGRFQSLKPLKYSEMFAGITAYDSDHIVALTYSGTVFTYQLSKNAWSIGRRSGIKDTQALSKLKDGRILIIGGEKQEGDINQQAVIYNPSSGTFTRAATMPGYQRDSVSMKAVTLTNGHVLVTGYHTLYRQEENFVYEYDPVKDEWRQPIKLNYIADSLVSNKDGDVLIYGAKTAETNSIGHLYTAATQTITPAAKIPMPINMSATVALADGAFMLIGGSSGSRIEPMNPALIFDQKLNRWQMAAPMLTERAGASAVGLPDGRIIAMGGYSYKGDYPEPTNTTEIYNAGSNSWSKGPAMKYSHTGALTAVLPNGNIFVLDNDGYSDIKTAEILKVYPQLKAKPVSYNTHKSAPVYLGTVVETNKLFHKDGWTYYQVYAKDTSLGFVAEEGNLEYSRKYMIRIQDGTNLKEPVIDGNFSFIKEENGLIFFIYNGYLCKMSLGAHNPEIIMKGEYPTITGTDALDFPYWNDEDKGSPLSVGMKGKDGDYFYTWFEHRQHYYPAKIRYDGSEIHILGEDEPKDGYFRQMEYSDGYIYYLTNPDTVQENEISTKGFILRAVKTDGSESKDLAHSLKFYLYKGKIYYNEMKDPQTGMKIKSFYSMNLDGTGKKRLDSESSVNLKFAGDFMYYHTYNTNNIVQLSLDGSSRKVLVRDTATAYSELRNVSGNSVIYDKYSKQNQNWLGEYRFDLRTFKEVRISGR